jgi:hypothetical protein
MRGLQSVITSSEYLRESSILVEELSGTLLLPQAHRREHLVGIVPHPYLMLAGRPVFESCPPRIHRTPIGGGFYAVPFRPQSRQRASYPNSLFMPPENQAP